MELKIVTINIEISDQYGTSKDILVGAFDDKEAMKKAIWKAQDKYNMHRNTTYVETVELNKCTNLN